MVVVDVGAAAGGVGGAGGGGGGLGVKDGELKGVSLSFCPPDLIWFGLVWFGLVC